MTSEKRNDDRWTKLIVVFAAVAVVAVLAMTANGIVSIGAAMHDAFHIH